MNGAAYRILLSPLITEKTTVMKDEASTVCFQVHPKARKNQIRAAIEDAFPGVYVESVHTVKVRGKRRRFGKNIGYRSDWKKAYIKLRKDSKPIEFFEHQ